MKSARRRAVASGLACAAGLVASCRDATQVTLVVRTDVPCDQIGSISITAGSPEAIERDLPRTETVACDGARIGTLVLIPADGSEQNVGVKVVLGIGKPASACIAPDYQGCIVARRSLSYVEHRSLVLPVDLRSTCLDVPCASGQTCIAGICRASLVTDPARCTDDAACADDAINGEASDTSKSRYAALVLSSRPDVYLRLGDKDGARAADATSNGNDGTYPGPSNVTLGSLGAIVDDPDTAATFRNSPLALAPALFDGCGSRPFTLEAWAQHTERSDEGAGHHMIQTACTEVFLQIGSLKFERDAGQGASRRIAVPALDPTRFTHVVGTFDGTTMRLYLDGKEVASTNGVGDVVPLGSPRLSIGANWQGLIDEVAIYPRALPPERIGAHYRAGRGLFP